MTFSTTLYPAINMALRLTAWAKIVCWIVFRPSFEIDQQVWYQSSNFSLQIIVELFKENQHISINSEYDMLCNNLKS